MSFAAFLCLYFSVSSAFDTSTYPNHYVLSNGTVIPSYDLYWTIDGNIIHIGLIAETTGWFGFGIGESQNGGMPGSDIVTMYVSESGANVVDRHAIEHALPIPDKCNDWVEVSSSTSNGYSFVELIRYLDTGDDTEDRPITPGLPLPVVFAVGLPDQTEVQYHDDRKGKGFVNWFPQTYTFPTPPSDVKEIRLTTNVALSSNTTTYKCYGFYLPELLDSNVPTQATSFKVEVDHTQIIHHLLLRRCSTNDTFWNLYHQNPGWSCFDYIPEWQLISSESSCNEMLYGWAVGATEWDIPQEVGLPLDDFHYLILEVHYNNMNNTVFIDDNDTTSIVISYTTSDLREFNGVGTIGGDPNLMLPPIPAGQSNFTYLTSCPSTCTQTLSPVTVFAVMLHSHMWVTGVGISIWRDGVFSHEAAWVDFFTFHNQNTWNIPEFVLHPGDEVYYHCRYDTTASDADIPMGISSLEEMCTLVMFWYPQLNVTVPVLPACGYFTNSSILCGEKLIPIPETFQPSLESVRIAARPKWGFDLPTECGVLPEVVMSLAERSCGTTWISLMALLATLITV